MASKTELNLITLGHVDHGKTTLIAAMTRYLAEKGTGKAVSYNDLQRAPAQEAQGLTLHAAHVQLETSSRRYNITDCSWDADVVKSLIADDTPLDGAIVVIPASGSDRKTRQQLSLAHQVGVPRVIVFLSKLDTVDDLEMVEMVELEVRDMLPLCGFSGEEPIVPGNALGALQGDAEAQKAIGELISMFIVLWPGVARVDERDSRPA